MEENFDGYRDELEASVRRYKNMLKNKESYYFDVFEFEHIIDFFMDKNDYQSAGEVLSYALNQHPHSIELQIKNAHVLIHQGYPVKALKLLEKIEKIEATNHSIFYLQAVVYTSMGNMSKALELFDYALNIAFEAKNDLLYNIAMTLKQAGRYDLSNKYFLKLYELEAEDTSVLFELGDNYDKLQETDNALRFYKEYIAHNPFSSTVWYHLGRSYQNIGKHELAVQSFDYAIAIEPDYKSAYFQKGISLYFNEEYYSSISAFEDYLELNENDTEALYHIGEVYSKIEDYPRANEYFDKVLQIDNEFEDAWYSKAVLAYELGKYVDAQYYVKKAIQLEDEEVDFWKLYATICRLLDFTDEAEKAYKKTLELDNNDPKIWIEYSKVNFGYSKIYKTINILSEANELFENNAEINFRLAGYLALINNFDAAMFHLKLALQQDITKLSAFRSVFKQKNEDIEELITQFLGTEQTKS